MARRSKTRDGSSPNTILVIFLVLFILSNIGFGVWVYNLFQERDKWDKAAADKDVQIKAVQNTSDFYRLWANELRAGVGDPEFTKKQDAVGAWREKRKDAANLYGAEPEYNEYKETVALLEKNLGGFADTTYRTTLLEVPDPIAKKLAVAQPELAKKTAEYKAKDAEYLALQKKFDTERQQLLNTIKSGNDEALKARVTANSAMTEALKNNADLRKEIDDRQEEFRKELTGLEKKVKVAEEKIKQQESVVKSPNKALIDPHALILDVSRGKPLWDLPRGKIVRLDDATKRVYINKGSKDGVKPGLTFNVFAASWNQRGDGPLKATIEVIRADGDHSAVCKINTFFDVDGHEIPVYDATPAKVLREGASALKEGDLLFNMFWGSHAAVVGVVDFTGYGATSPGGQMDNLFDFMRHLERMGIIVDAYLDLRDGKMIGQVTPQTNYLIRGSTATSLGASDSEERLKLINDGMRAMREQAVDKGMFIISPENFAIVSGYRRTSGADDVQKLDFTPRRPAVGTPIVGENTQQPPPQPEMEKKN